MSIQVYAPDGAVGGEARELAAPLDTLAERRLAILDNGKPNADVLMQRMANALVERTAVQYTGMSRKQTAATPCDAELLANLAQNADLVITGSAD